MYMKFALLGLVAIGVSACARNPNVPGEKELTPTVTTRSWGRTETGALSGHETLTVETIASIVTIDYDTRRMTVRNAAGMEETFIVAPEVARLNELKIGDKVATRHLHSIAFEVRPPTQSEIANPRTARSTSVALNPSTLPPGVRADSLRRVIVTIQEIDPTKKAVTVRTPEGQDVIFYARNPENLNRAKIGDTVAITYGESTAIDVKPLS